MRALFESGEFVEVYVNASLDKCEERDPKGLYRKARAGLISDFTGIDSPYEAPERPEVQVCTDTNSVDARVQQILAYLTDCRRLTA